MAYVCGVIEHRADSPLAKSNFSWPFGRVDFREQELFADAPISFGHWTLHVPYGDIRRATLQTHRWGGRIRLHRTTDQGDVTIVAFSTSYLQIADQLRARDVVVRSAN